MNTDRVISMSLVDQKVLYCRCGLPMDELAPEVMSQHATDKLGGMFAARGRWMTRVEQSLEEARLRRDPFRTGPQCLVEWMKMAFDFLIKMSQVNPAGGTGFGPSVKRCDLPIWSKLAEIYLAYFAVKLIVCELMQHEYNRISFELEAMNRSSSSAMHLRLDEYTKLVDDLRRTDERLDVVGSPWREIRYPVEMVYMFNFTVCYFAYAGIKLFVYGKGPVRLGVLRFLLDEEKERINIDRDICKQLDELLISNDNYLRASYPGNNLNGSEKHKMEHIFNCNDKSSAANENKFQKELRRHSLFAKEVLHLVLGDWLRPLNRTNRWLSNMQTLASMLILVMEAAGFLLIVLYFNVIPKLMVPAHIHDGPTDLMFTVEAIIYGAVGLQVCCLYLVLLVLSSVDMVQYALELRKLIEEAVKMTYQIRGATSTIRARQHHLSLIRQLNSSLIGILVHFKMFREQLATIQGIQGYGLSFVIIDMMVCPVLGRLGAARLDFRSKVIAIPSMIFIMILTDLIVGPACYLQARCLDIYRSLASLLANLVAAKQASCSKIDDSWSTSGLSFSQCLLQRELNVPELLVTRFTTRTKFGPVTYSRFLTIHFWCGLLMISLWMNDSRSTGNTIADSLRLF